MEEVTFERCSSNSWQCTQCREPAANRGYINSAVCHFVHYESGGEAVRIGQSIPRKFIAKRSARSKSHSASKSSRIVDSLNSIRIRGVIERGRINRLNSDNGVMARTKQSERKRDGERQDGVTPAVHGHPCPRCHKVFDRKYNLTRHTVRKHYITPEGNPATEQMRSRFLEAGTHKNPAKDEAKAPPLKIRKITKAGFRDDPVSGASRKSEHRVSKKISAPHTATSTLPATGLDPGELPWKDELARSSTPDLPDSEPEAWESAPVSVDVEIGAQLRGDNFEAEQRGSVVEPFPESPNVTVNVWGAGSSAIAEQANPCLRKATRPMPPCPGKKDRAISKVAQLKATLSALNPAIIPRTAPGNYSVEKRPVLTKRAIAKAVWPRRGKPLKHAKDIAEQLRVKYQLTSTEHLRTYKLICQTKASYRMMAERVRKECPTFIEEPQQRHLMVESIMDIIQRVEEDSSGVDDQ